MGQKLYELPFIFLERVMLELPNQSKKYNAFIIVQHTHTYSIYKSLIPGYLGWHQKNFEDCGLWLNHIIHSQSVADCKMEW